MYQVLRYLKLLVLLIPMLLSCQKEIAGPIAVTAVSLNAESAELNEGEAIQLVATVSPNNAENKAVIWSSSNASVASVVDGMVTALKAGKATITVKTDDGGKKATCEITVNAKVCPVKSVSLDMTSVELTEGDEISLTATVNPDNATNKNVTWTSSDSSVASVSNGNVTALKAGKTTITVKTDDGGKTATCEVTVNADVYPVKSVSLDKTSVELTEGDELTLTATVNPDNATNKSVTWNSSNASVASVVDGKVTALKAGKATITVRTDDGGKTATCEVVVSEAPYAETLVLSESYLNAFIYGDQNRYYLVDATVTPSDAVIECEWISSDERVATVSGDNESAKIFTNDYGISTITVKDKRSGLSASVTVHTILDSFDFDVKSQDSYAGCPLITIYVDETYQLPYTCSPSHATNVFCDLSKFKFYENNRRVETPTLISIDAGGKVTGLKAGLIEIKSGNLAYKSNGDIYIKVVEKTIPVTSVSLDKTSVELTEGDELTLTATVNPDNATNKDVAWISSNSSVASVVNGKITALKAGYATITVKTEDGDKTATCEVAVVEPPEAESLSIKFYNTSGTVGGCLYIGQYYDFSVTSEPSDAVVNYEWKVENEKIATISGNGNTARIYTKDYGKTNVVVTDLRSGISKSYEIGTVVTDFMFTEDTGETNYGYPMITMVVGETHQLKCSYNPSYATGVFRGLNSFNVQEVNTALNTYVIVDEPTTVDIDENGFMTAKNVGTTILSNNSGGYITSRASGAGSKAVFINVISEYTESEYNDEMSYADVIKAGNKMKFRISNSNDIDIFKFTSPANLNGYFDIKITYQGDLGTPTGVDKHLRWELYNGDLTPFGSGDLSFKSEGSSMSPSQVWLNTRQGYVRFYIKDYWKNYPSAIPSGYFTVEFIPK